MSRGAAEVLSKLKLELRRAEYVCVWRWLCVSQVKLSAVGSRMPAEAPAAISGEKAERRAAR